MNRFELILGHDDLGVTPLENIFINHYMPMARGDYVKVYLYGLKRCYNQGLAPINNADIAKDLNLLETDVKKAWEYWVSEGILSLEYTGTRDALIRFFNITGTMLYKNEEVEKTLKKPTVHESSNLMQDRIHRMYDTIQDMYESRILSKRETLLFKNWLEDYQFTPEAVILIVEHSLNIINKKEKTFTPAQLCSYLDTVAKGFHKAGVQNHIEADAHIKKSAEKTGSYYQIFKYLGIKRNPMVNERELMDLWFNDFGFSMEIIMEALSRTSKPNLKYIHGILKNWHDQGFKNLEDVKNDRPKKSQKFTKTIEPLNDSRKESYLKIDNDFIDHLWEGVDSSHEEKL